jgi:hypothetical protein
VYDKHETQTQMKTDISHRQSEVGKNLNRIHDNRCQGYRKVKMPLMPFLILPNHAAGSTALKFKMLSRHTISGKVRRKHVDIYHNTLTQLNDSHRFSF